jgi:threonine dehydratase
VVPVSGGGLIAGCGIVARASRKPVRVIGVEPEDADDFRRSLAAGQRVALPQSTTIADALRVATPGRVTFPIAQEVVDEIVTVSDDEVLTALRGVFEIGRLVIEPSAAVGIAALLAGRIVPRAGAVGVIVSGGNIAPHQFADLVAPREQPAGASAQHGEMSLRQVRT